MARLQDLAVGRKDLYMLDPRIMQTRPGWNGRNESPEVVAHIRRMADAMKENGVGAFPPVVVNMEGDIPYLDDGHCRHAAALLAISEGAEIRAIAARAEEKGTNDAERVLGILTRNSGLPLAPMEQSGIVKRLLAFGWGEREIAKKTGFSLTHINNLLTLSSAPEAVKDIVRNGEVSASTAINQVRKEGGSKAAESLKTAINTAKAAGKGRATAKHLPVAEPEELEGQQVLDLDAKLPLDTANERIVELESLLKSIGDYAHDRSTGPALPDDLWEVRRMAYGGYIGNIN